MNFLIAIPFVEWITESCIITIVVHSHFDCTVKMSHWGWSLTYVSLNNCEGYKISYIFISQFCLFEEVSIQLFKPFFIFYKIYLFLFFFQLFLCTLSFVIIKNLISFLKTGVHILYIIYICICITKYINTTCSVHIMQFLCMFFSTDHVVQ